VLAANPQAVIKRTGLLSLDYFRRACGAMDTATLAHPARPAGERKPRRPPGTV